MNLTFTMARFIFLWMIVAFSCEAYAGGQNDGLLCADSLKNKNNDSWLNEISAGPVKIKYARRFNRNEDITTGFMLRPYGFPETNEAHVNSGVKATAFFEYTFAHMDGLLFDERAYYFQAGLVTGIFNSDFWYQRTDTLPGESRYVSHKESFTSIGFSIGIGYRMSMGDRIFVDVMAIGFNYLPLPASVDKTIMHNGKEATLEERGVRNSLLGGPGILSLGGWTNWGAPGSKILWPSVTVGFRF